MKSKGIVIGVAQSKTFDYVKLAENFIENSRSITDLPIFALTNFQKALPVDCQQYIEYISGRKRRLITGYGKINIDFAVDIKLLACIHSPFDESLWVDLDYRFFQKDFEKYFAKSGLTLPKKVYFIGDYIHDEDLIFSWIFKFNQKHKPIFLKVLKDLEIYHFTDRSFYYNLKNVNYNTFDFSHLEHRI